jgi:chemotaxis protein methyltransferase CheR
MVELGLPSAAAYRALLEADRGEWSVFDACCRISISRFHRDHRVFEELAGKILPALARAATARDRRSLRAWSAGCASGEEPYSLRLAWDLVAAPAAPDAELQIVATDVSADLLERARRGVYPASALKELPAGWRSTAFDLFDGSYRLRDRFRLGVNFRQEDIRETMPSGPFDLILCRNLAFTYFEPELQRAVLKKLVERIVPGGALVVGSHEALPEPAARLRSASTAGLYYLENGAPA